MKTTLKRPRKQYKKLRQGYWLFRNGMSYWGIAAPNTFEITEQVHRMPRHIKACVFGAEKYEVS